MITEALTSEIPVDFHVVSVYILKKEGVCETDDMSVGPEFKSPRLL